MKDVVVALLVTSVVACSPPRVADVPQPPTTGAASETPTTVPSPAAAGEPSGLSFPRGPLPDTAREVAAEFRTLSPSLLDAIAKWRRKDGRVGSDLGRSIALAALRRQKILRMLAKDERLERRVLAHVPPRLAREIRVHTRASRSLASIVTPVSGRFHLPTKQPDPVHELRSYYERAERRFEVPWELLASINLVETRFGRLSGASTSGARGPMQFIPSTWAIYGRGDIDDPRAAIMAAARYLVASGAPEDLRSAVYSYNHSYAYVDAILTYFREMQRDDRNYYSYYFWQVFVATTKGDVQLTGPGGRRPYIR